MAAVSATVKSITENHAAMIGKELAAADKFVEAADCRGLRALLMEAHKRESNTLAAMDTLCSLYADKASARPAVEEVASVAAMRDVALAAIGLAKCAFGTEAAP